jgi:cytochrome c peroxidase
VILSKLTKNKCFIKSVCVAVFLFCCSAFGSDWQALYKRPTSIPFPSDNLYSTEKAALGKMLFFDPRLSQNFNMTCATCHNPSFGWEDATKTSIGSLNTSLSRHSPTIINMAWGNSFFWDGRAKTLEAQAQGPIESKVEMNISLDTVVKRLSKVPQYTEWFKRVFGSSGISGDNIRKAIATYERTVVSGLAPFDQWIEGDDNAISNSAKRGFTLFNGKANCAACHQGWNFTDNQFHDVGLSGTDLGLGALTKNSKDNFSFKTPGLRNIGQRAPYMHDGRFKSLSMVIVHYVGGIIDRKSRSEKLKTIMLTAQEVNDLEAFLLTLTGEDTPVTLPLLPY